jgi:hypothetical protein
MPKPGLIEVLLVKELQGLCMNCANFEPCSYRKTSVKTIIQCELYEMGMEPRTAGQEESYWKGLCVSCGNADTCSLPDKQFGTWHCEEYG